MLESGVNFGGNKSQHKINMMDSYIKVSNMIGDVKNDQDTLEVNEHGQISRFGGGNNSQSKLTSTS